jgi:hypothetical protein
VQVYELSYIAFYKAEDGSTYALEPYGGIIFRGLVDDFERDDPV